MKGFRSFIGAYKVLSRVLPNCSNVIAPLECAVTGLQCSDRLLWEKNLTSRFKSAQDFLSNRKAIFIPCHCTSHVPITSSLLLRRFVFLMAEASAKRVTGDEPQGTMGRVQTAGEAPARSCVVFLAKKSFSWHGPIFGLFKSWKRSILVAYCCKHCKL